jgi:hypothetical protein
MCIQTYNHDAAAQQQALAQQTAQQQQNDETQRENNISAGKASIDNAFSGFNDDYFNKYTQAQIDAANQQINNQYGVASDQLNAALAGRGIDNSTIAGSYYKNLQQTETGAQGDAANTAADNTNALKNNVEQQKANLYSLNTGSADPSTIATEATGAATALKPPQAFTSLGNLFSGVLAPLATAATANNYSPYTSGIFSPTTLASSGNAKVG